MSEKEVVTISSEHEHTHDGNSWVAFFSNTVTNTDEQSVIAFRTPPRESNKQVHLTFVGKATALATVTLNKNTSIDAGEGTDVAAVSRNESAGKSSLIKSITSPAVIGSYTTLNEAEAAGANITETTVVYSEQIGAAGNPATKSGGESRGSSEFVLDFDTEYAVIVNADDDNDNQQSIVLNWYTTGPHKD
ncbi:hypothetical protein KAR91_08790 [Candidatus Pacearchaeota archaeon]|nr:hypothetical protein [Candidatus Pacearchaeota archaeon]